MFLFNITNTVPIYSVTVPFDHNGTNREIIYKISTTDSTGNSWFAYDIQLDDPDRISETRFIYSPPGIDPTFVILIVGITIIAAIFGSVVYVKFIRQPELIGLDKSLVISKIKDIDNDEVRTSLDLHTLGIVLSYFDQKEGPVPIIILPELLRDNYYKLVELSDRSFSSAGFTEDFDVELPANYDFELGRGLRIGVMSYAFSLINPSARGGKENLTINILLNKDVAPLIYQFQDEIQEKVHEAHMFMKTELDERKKIAQQIIEIRKFITYIVLAYKTLYGTTELLSSEE
jgi:hypothetical protein